MQDQSEERGPSMKFFSIFSPTQVFSFKAWIGRGLDSSFTLILKKVRERKSKQRKKYPISWNCSTTK